MGTVEHDGSCSPGKSSEGVFGVREGAWRALLCRSHDLRSLWGEHKWFGCTLGNLGDLTGIFRARCTTGVLGAELFYQGIYGVGSIQGIQRHFWGSQVGAEGALRDLEGLGDT